MRKSRLPAIWLLGTALLLLAGAVPALAQGPGYDLTARNWLPFVFRPPPVTILLGTSVFTEDNGRMHFFGEVQNTLPAAVQKVWVAVRFYDAAGQPLGTAYGAYTPLPNLPPGATTCFALDVMPPAGWASYRFNEPTYSGGGHLLPNLNVLNTNWRYVNAFSRYELTGEVRNDGVVRVDRVRMAATFYDAAGQVLECRYVYVQGPGFDTSLDPGEQSPFQTLYESTQGSYGARLHRMAYWRTQADGDYSQ